MRTVTALIFIGAAIAIFVVWTQPLILEVKESSARAEVLDNSLSKLKELQAIRDSLLGKYNSIEESDIDYLNKFLPSKPAAIDFVLEIDNIAESNGVSLKSIDVKDPDRGGAQMQEEEGSVRRIPVVMKVTGPYKSFVAFIYDIERNLRLTKIENIDFKAGEIDLYDYNVTVSTYWLK